MADTATTNPLAAGLSGVLSMIQGLSSGPYGAVPQAQQAAALADPFAAQRPQYQQQLSDLMKDPSSFQADPGYQFALTQGLNAIKGNAGATYGGTAGLGGLDPELAKYAAGYASQNYDNRIAQLGQFSGSTTGSPGTAGQILAGGFQQQTSDLSGGIAGLLTGLGGLLGGLGSGGGSPITINNSVGGGSGDSIPYGGGGGPYDLTGTGPSSPWSLLGLDHGTSQGYNPMAGFQIPGGIAGLFGTDPSIAQRWANIQGYLNAPGDNAQPSTATPGFPSGSLGSLFSQTQGGGAFGSTPWGSLFGGGTSGAGGGADPNPDDWSGWMTGGGGSGAPDWLSSLMSGGGDSSSIDWSSLFGG